MLHSPSVTHLTTTGRSLPATNPKPNWGCRFKVMILVSAYSYSTSNWFLGSLYVDTFSLWLKLLKNMYYLWTVTVTWPKIRPLLQIKIYSLWSGWQTGGYEKRHTIVNIEYDSLNWNLDYLTHCIKRHSFI